MFITDPREEVLNDREKADFSLSAWPRVDTSQTFYQVYTCPDEDSLAHPAAVHICDPHTLRAFIEQCQTPRNLAIQDILVTIPPAIGGGRYWITEKLLEIIATFDSDGRIISLDHITPAACYSESFEAPQGQTRQETLYSSCRDGS